MAPLITAPVVEASVTVPVIVPVVGVGVSAIFAVAVPPAATDTLALLLEKPLAEAVIVYVPGGTVLIV